VVLEPQATDTGDMNNRRSILEPQATKKKSSSTIIVVVSVVRGSSLQYLLVVALVGISCRSWLRYLSSRPVALHGSSICRCSCGSSDHRSPVAPVSVAPVAPVVLAPVSVVRGFILSVVHGSIISCRSWLR